MGHHWFCSEGDTTCPCLPAEISFSFEKAYFTGSNRKRKEVDVLLKALQSSAFLQWNPS